MNHALAVDASVAVKWVIYEEFTDRALKLWADSLALDRPVIAPPHFTGEVANAIYQRLRSTDPARHLPLAEADQALTLFLQYPVEAVAPAGLVARAFTLAQTAGLPSIYDSLHVVLADLLDVELWTADQRLLDALGSNAPRVRFIGHYPV